MVDVELSDRIVNIRSEDCFLPVGEYGRLEKSICGKVGPETGVVIYTAYDSRTEVGPFIGTNAKMPSCGSRAVGAAFSQAGFNTRVVLGVWNPRFDFQHARLSGKVPEIFGIGTMLIHEEDAHRKIEQAASMGDKRPLIIGGGSHATYEAWDFFDVDEKKSVDVVVSGEINVALSLMENILEHKGRKETMRQGFERARGEGGLNSVQGITYISEDRAVLVDTGPAKLIADLDEFPRELVGLGLIEPRSKRRKDLSNGPIPLNLLRRNGVDTVSMITSQGCNLSCSYCSLPRQQRYTLRAKSSERMVSDFEDIVESINPPFIFGSDDNSMAFKRGHLERLYGAMAEAGLGKRMFYGTEATEGQAYACRDLIPLAREAGVRAIWFGIEDISQTLVKKGQSESKTIELFRILRENGIAPMPMMMHFDGQPLRSAEKGNLDGLLDQVRFLKEHGAVSMQITYEGPAIGSKIHPEHFEKGAVLTKVGDMSVEPYLWDGNRPISTKEKDVLGRQKNMVTCYEEFYSWKNLARSAIDYLRAWKNGGEHEKSIAATAFGMQFLARGRLRVSKRNLRPWMKALETGVFEYATEVPQSPIPIVPASEFAHTRVVVETLPERVSYEAHTANLFDRFVKGAEQFIDRHKGNVSVAREKLYDMAGGIATHERERLTRLGEGAKELYQDWGEGAERLGNELRERMQTYIDSKFPVVE